MANKEIGEIDIQLGGKEYTLRPTFSALVEIESRSEMGLLKIASIVAGQDIYVKTIAAVIYGGVKGALPKGQSMPFTFEACGDMVMQQGIMSLVPPVMEFLTAAMAGRHPDGEKKTEVAL